jgi:hypothetical protein
MSFTQHVEVSLSKNEAKMVLNLVPATLIASFAFSDRYNRINFIRCMANSLATSPECKQALGLAGTPTS